MDAENVRMLSKDGLELEVKIWEANAPKAAICIIHDLGDHGGSYEKMSAYFNDREISVFVLDLRGHGLSKGRKGHAPNLDSLLSDIEELLKTTRAHHTELPIFLLGLGLGANLVLNYLEKMNNNEIHGFIMINPWRKFGEQSSLLWKLFGQIGYLLFPRWLVSQGQESNTLKENGGFTDPLRHRKVSLGLTRIIHESLKSIHSSNLSLNKPGVIVEETDNQGGTMQSTLAAINKIAYKSGPFGMTNQANWDNVPPQIEELSAWIKQQISQN